MVENESFNNIIGFDHDHTNITDNTLKFSIKMYDRIFSFDSALVVFVKSSDSIKRIIIKMIYRLNMNSKVYLIEV